MQPQFVGIYWFLYLVAIRTLSIFLASVKPSCRPTFPNTCFVNLPTTSLNGSCNSELSLAKPLMRICNILGVNSSNLSCMISESNPNDLTTSDFGYVFCEFPRILETTENTKLTLEEESM